MRKNTIIRNTMKHLVSPLLERSIFLNRKFSKALGGDLKKKAILNHDYINNKTSYNAAGKGAYIKNTSQNRSYQTIDKKMKAGRAGSIAFAECETSVISDLFFEIARKNKTIDKRDGSTSYYLCFNGVKELLSNIGESAVDEETISQFFQRVDTNSDGKLQLQELLAAADNVLGSARLRVILVVGGPGSGKGILCKRLSNECGIIHLSSGDLLRSEVALGTPLGLECKEIMKRGELVSSAVITALIRRRMGAYPGRRVLLDGFPRSLENAQDFLALCGKPELALHLDCDDTILMERIIKRKRESEAAAQNGLNGNSALVRDDDNFDTAIQRLRTFHKYHHQTLDWLREQHVPIVNLDCSGTPENVWNQLLAIGRLMRPAAQKDCGLPNDSIF